MIVSTRLFLFAAPLSLVTLASLPISSNFDADTVGQPPALGGPDQPSSLYLSSGSTILVQSSAVGQNTQPVELYDDSGDYVSVDYSFPPVTTEVVRLTRKV